MKENYKGCLRAAKEDLRTTYEGLVAVVNERGSGDHRHISAKHKMETHFALFQLTASYQIAARSNSLKMVQAVRQAMAGTFFIVWHCGASPAAKKYWDLKSHGPAGEASGRRRKDDADIRDAWVRLEITRLLARNKKLTPDDLAEKMRAKTAPVNLLCHDRLVRFIRNELEIRKAGKKSSLRLVG